LFKKDTVAGKPVVVENAPKDQSVEALVLEKAVVIVTTTTVVLV